MKLSTCFFSLILSIFMVGCQPSSSAQSVDSKVQPAPQSQPPLPPPNEERSVEASDGTAKEVAIPFSEVTRWGVGGVPAWPGSIEQLHQLVQEARNVRLYPNPNPGSYLRRAPWYYGDGCYAKAAHLSALAERSGYPRPGKVLAFGGWATMRYVSAYLPGGAAWWNYHVVAAYHINFQVYVLDPLVSSDRALSVDEWVRAIAPRPEKITVAFCDQNLYDKNDRCLGGHKDGAYLGDIDDLLKNEYESLRKQGFDPDSVL